MITLREEHDSEIESLREDLFNETTRVLDLEAEIKDLEYDNETLQNELDSLRERLRDIFLELDLVKTNEARLREWPRVLAVLGTEGGFMI